MRNNTLKIGKVYSRWRIHPFNTFRSCHANVWRVMPFTPFDDSIKISALVYDVKVWPRRLSSANPIVCNDPNISIADEFLTQDFYAMI